MLNKIRHWLRVLRTPSCWILSDSIDWEWDRELNRMLDAPVFTEEERHTVKLNGIEVWISNYPYAYGSRWRKRCGGMPCRKTIFRLRDALANNDTLIPATKPTEQEEWPEYITGSWR